MTGVRRRVAGGVLASAAFAALSVTGVGAQTLEVTVPTATTAGALSITPPSGTVTASVSGSTATLSIPWTQVNDTRTTGGSPTLTGWTASVSVSTPLSNGGSSIPGSAMTWTTGTRQKHDSVLNVWGDTSEFSGGTGTMNAAVAAGTAPAGVGYGAYRYNASIAVDITGQASGTYTGAITQTVS